MADKKKKKNKEVEIVLALNERGAPVLRFKHDKDSSDISQQLLGVFVRTCKSHTAVLHLETGKETSDGMIYYEVKVQGT